MSYVYKHRTSANVCPSIRCTYFVFEVLPVTRCALPAPITAQAERHKETLRLPLLRVVFEAIDKDKSGSVNYSELAAFGQVRRAPLVLVKCESVLSVYNPSSLNSAPLSQHNRIAEYILSHFFCHIAPGVSLSRK